MSLLSISIAPPDAVLRLVRLLQTLSPMPRVWGTYHVLMLAVAVFAVYLLWRYGRDASDHTFRVIVGTIWGVLVLFEVLKQGVSSSFIVADRLVLAYPWSIFPFQLCSTPFYILPFVAFWRDGFLRRACMAYSATFALFGGLIVLLTPASVFSITYFGNIQTMVHHILQMAVGVYIAVHERYEMRFWQLFGGCGVFLFLLGTAVHLNERMHVYLLEKGISTTFNMFFISPYHPSPIAPVNTWYDRLSALGIAFFYALGLSVMAFAVFFVLQMAARAYDTIERNARPSRR